MSQNSEAVAAKWLREYLEFRDVKLMFDDSFSPYIRADEVLEMLVRFNEQHNG